MSMSDRVVLVTGGTSGIGLEVVKLFSTEGYRVHVFGRNNEKIKSSKLENVYFYKTDLSDLDNLEKSCKTVLSKESKGVDIIVNSAGVFFLRSCEDITLKDYNRIFDVNVRAPIFIIKFFLESMKKKGKGKIFNVGSSSCYNGGKFSSLYCASKHALLGYSKSISDELKKYNIRVCNLSPSSTKTKMGEIPLASNQLYDTFIDPREVAETLYFISKFNGNMEIKELLLNRVNVQ